MTEPIMHSTIPIVPEKFRVSLRRTTESIALTTTLTADNGVTRIAGLNAYAPKLGQIKNTSITLPMPLIRVQIAKLCLSGTRLGFQTREIWLRFG